MLDCWAELFLYLYLGQTQKQLRSWMKPFLVLLGYHNLLWRRETIRSHGVCLPFHLKNTHICSPQPLAKGCQVWESVICTN